MDTGGQDQVIFDMDQGYNQQSYTQEQVDEMNQQLNQTRWRIIFFHAMILI